MYPRNTVHVIDASSVLHVDPNPMEIFTGTPGFSSGAATYRPRTRTGSGPFAHSCATRLSTTTRPSSVVPT